jgi:ankyrin repeat protein
MSRQAALPLIDPSLTDAMTVEELKSHLKFLSAPYNSTSRTTLIKRLYHILNGNETAEEKHRRKKRQQIRFHSACWRGDYMTVLRLLDYGVALDVEMEMVVAGWTAIYKRGNTDILKLLIKRGARVNAVDTYKVCSCSE